MERQAADQRSQLEKQQVNENEDSQKVEENDSEMEKDTDDYHTSSQQSEFAGEQLVSYVRKGVQRYRKKRGTGAMATQVASHRKEPYQASSTSQAAKGRGRAKSDNKT